MQLQIIKQRFLESDKFKDLAASSKRHYKCYLGATSGLDHQEADDLTKQVIMDQIRWAKPSDGARWLAMAVHCSFFNWAVEEGHMKDNVLKNSRKPKIGTRHRWTEAQLKKVGEFIKQHQSDPEFMTARAAYIAVRNSGQRLGDISMAKLSQFDGKIFRFVQQKTGNVVEFEPNGEFLALIHEQRDKGDSYLVPVPKSIIARERYIYRQFSIMTKKAGIRQVFHGLRKSTACEVAEGGGDGITLQALLGHKSPRMSNMYIAEANRTKQASKAVRILEARRKKDG